MCALTQNAATPIDHTGSPSALLLLTALPGRSCVGKSRVNDNVSQNRISWHQGNNENKCNENKKFSPAETICVEYQCGSDCAQIQLAAQMPMA